VISDIGAIEFGWWHCWHFAWRILETSCENVGGVAESAARAGAASARHALAVISDRRALRNPG
jgi:hypothetical protein